MRKVVIIGGGITGLAAGHYLRRRATDLSTPVEWTLLEAETRLGGKVVTDRTDDGYIVEGGPDSFVTDKQGCLNLCHELGLGEELIPANEIQRKIYVLHRGKLTAMPAGFRLAIPTEIMPFVTTPLISLPGKLRMAMEYFVPRGSWQDDVSLAEFFGRRFGRECVDSLAGPMMAGIFVSDPDRMSMQGTFPSFIDMEQRHGSLIRAARAARKKPPTPNPRAAGRSMFNSLRRGLNSMIDALATELGGHCRTGVSVSGLNRNGDRWQVETSGGTLDADHVVLAVPSFVAADLIRPHQSALADQLAAIRYVSTATVSLAYLRADVPLDLDGFGVLVPPREKRQIIACTWSSVKFRHRAPPGSVLLRGFVGGYHNEAVAALPDDELLRVVREEYRELFGIHAEPLLTRIYRWPRANPQYDVGHPARVRALEKAMETLPGLHLAGSPYHGIGMPDCVRSASRAVEAILPIRKGTARGTAAGARS